MRRIERENHGTVRPGQDLVVAGYTGLSGTVKIAEIKKEELLTWFSKDYICRILKIESSIPAKSAVDFKKFGATEWEPAGEGGILKALWDLSGAYMTGIRFDLRKIPVRQETIEISERYDLNPYRLFSDGCFVLTADHGLDLVSELTKQRINAAVIGKVTDGIKRIVVHEDSIGYLDRPAKDELYKVIERMEQSEVSYERKDTDNN